MNLQTEVVVLGSGPGGMAAAFRAADLGKKVVLVERYQNLGGVCLNVGCIPSKALLHQAEIINEAKNAKHLGIHFDVQKIDKKAILENKQTVVDKLANGVQTLAKTRKVQVEHGGGKFISAHQIALDNETIVTFEHCVIAVGSSPAKIPPMIDDPRVLDSTAALEIDDIPRRLLIIGGGIIGLEMATIYDALGSEITIIEAAERIIKDADADIVAPLARRIKKNYKNILTNTKIVKMKAMKNGIEVGFENSGKTENEIFDRVLVAVGRTPNGKKTDAEKAGVNIDENGFIAVNQKMQTNIDHIYAIGDVIGQPMLAHKAAHEGKIAAEAICGHKVGFDALVIPAVAYTDPEVAWVGKNEQSLKAEGVAFKKGVFPWAASGRNLSVGRQDGITKMLFDAKTGRLLGAGICGKNAGELIAEAALAIEMGADAEDLSLTVHPHPTLSETLAFAAEVVTGKITDLPPPRKK